MDSSFAGTIGSGVDSCSFFDAKEDCQGERSGYEENTAWYLQD